MKISAQATSYPIQILSSFDNAIIISHVKIRPATKMFKISSAFLYQCLLNGYPATMVM